MLFTNTLSLFLLFSVSVQSMPVHGQDTKNIIIRDKPDEDYSIDLLKRNAETAEPDEGYSIDLLKREEAAAEEAAKGKPETGYSIDLL